MELFRLIYKSPGHRHFQWLTKQSLSLILELGRTEARFLEPVAKNNYMNTKIFKAEGHFYSN